MTTANPTPGQAATDTLGASDASDGSQLEDGRAGGFAIGGRDPFVLLVAVAAAVVAAFSDGAPTGIPAWDAVLRAMMTIVVVVGASAGPRWILIAIAAVAGAFAGSTTIIMVAGLGLVVAVVSAVRPVPVWVPALSAALSAQALLRLAAVGFFGLPSLIAGVAVTATLLAGYRAATVSVRRLVVRAAAVLVVVCGVVGAVGGLVLLSARADVERGIEAARGGLSAARDGDPEAVVSELERAADALGNAESRANSWLARPLRLLPIAAQHHRAVTTATRVGSEIARQASRATIEADISEITLSAGSVDLSALSSMEDDLVRTVSLLEGGIEDLERTQSPWLVPQVGSRMDELTDELRDVLPEAQVAADAVRVVPGLLGSDQPRRYFVAFGSPAESRELGGFIGSWALVEFDAGRVSQVDAGRVADLYDIVRTNGPLDRDVYPPWYTLRARPDVWPQNLGSSPQLSTVADASRDLLDGLGGGPIDGFIYLDSYVLAALLEITGPVDIDGFGRLKAGNAIDFFFEDQYRLGNRDELKEDLGRAFGEIFEGLTDTRLPGPEQLGRILGPVARQGRLQVATFDPVENAFLRSVKLQRVFAAPTVAEDGFGLVQATGSVSKLDLYLHRSLDYEVSVDADGQLEATVTIKLDSRVPDDAPAYAIGRDNPGLNKLFLSLYSPHELVGVTVDGDEVEVAALREFSFERYEVEFEVPANTSRVVQYRLTGSVELSGEFDVAIWHQPLVNADAVTVSYSGPDGSSWQRAIELTENVVLSAEE